MESVLKKKGDGRESIVLEEFKAAMILLDQLRCNG